MAHTFSSFKIEHVYRDQNAEADALANQALDETSRSPSPRHNPAEVKPQPQPRKVRAHVRNGAFVPVAPLDLPEGSEVEILVRPTAKS
jgi:hypothetical protein